MADLAIGYAQNVFRDGQKGPFGMNWWELSAYLMDDFRISPKLTLVDTPGAGPISSTVHSSRQIQLALKLSF